MKWSHSILSYASKTMQICGYLLYTEQIRFKHQGTDCQQKIIIYLMGHNFHYGPNKLDLIYSKNGLSDSCKKS